MRYRYVPQKTFGYGDHVRVVHPRIREKYRNQAGVIVDGGCHKGGRATWFDVQLDGTRETVQILPEFLQHVVQSVP